MNDPAFSALCIIRDNQILMNLLLLIFSTSQPHSIQSITKASYSYHYWSVNKPRDLVVRSKKLEIIFQILALVMRKRHYNRY